MLFTLIIDKDYLQSIQDRYNKVIEYFYQSHGYNKNMTLMQWYDYANEKELTIYLADNFDALVNNEQIKNRYKETFDDKDLALDIINMYSDYTLIQILLRTDINFIKIAEELDSSRNFNCKTIPLTYINYCNFSSDRKDIMFDEKKFKLDLIKEYNNTIRLSKLYSSDEKLDEFDKIMNIIKIP